VRAVLDLYGKISSDDFTLRYFRLVESARQLFKGLDAAERKALLRYLDPFDETYNERHDVPTCLVGFDFDGFVAVAKSDPTKAEADFAALAEKELHSVAPKLTKALVEAGLDGRPVEIFFFPVPSVQELRDVFQVKIGWKQ
jgi:hypothetical protein